MLNTSQQRLLDFNGFDGISIFQLQRLDSFNFYLYMDNIYYLALAEKTAQGYKLGNESYKVTYFKKSL